MPIRGTGEMAGKRTGTVLETAMKCLNLLALASAAGQVGADRTLIYIEIYPE